MFTLKPEIETNQQTILHSAEIILVEMTPEYPTIFLLYLFYFFKL